MNNIIRRPLSEAQEQLLEKLLSEAGNSRYKAVSMKMMDTLVVLPFTDKSDIFTFMEDEFSGYYTGNRSFAELRKSAEEAALKKAGVYTRVKLEKIYDILAKLSGISPTGKEKLMERECGLIERFAFPRECGKAIFREAKSNNKRVIITAESIYPRDTLVRILENCGYGSYDGLVVVSEIKNSTAKSWFTEAVEQAGVSPDRLLHIGGDVAFDVELPIVNGAKSLLLSPVGQLMERSGRVRGYIEDRKVLDYDEPKMLALRCIFGLYSVYGFDIPQNKSPLSDFCRDEYMLGFLAAGAAGMKKDFVPKKGLQEKIFSALSEDRKFLDGKADLEAMFDLHFGSLLDSYGYEGCEIPLEFLEKFCASADREAFKPYISGDAMKKWASSVKEPDIISYKVKHPKQNAVSRLADKMFPPGTRVRNITDEIMAKGKSKLKKKR